MQIPVLGVQYLGSDPVFGLHPIALDLYSPAWPDPSSGMRRSRLPCYVARQRTEPDLPVGRGLPAVAARTGAPAVAARTGADGREVWIRDLGLRLPAQSRAFVLSDALSESVQRDAVFAFILRQLVRQTPSTTGPFDVETIGARLERHSSRWRRVVTVP